MARKLVMVGLIVGCLVASGVILAPKLAGRAELHRREQAHAARLAESLAFIDRLEIGADHRVMLRAATPALHDDAFEDCYDPDANPPLDEALYMRHFTHALYAHASGEGERALADDLRAVFRAHPRPGRE
jgi:hypothetical protein